MSVFFRDREFSNSSLWLGITSQIWHCVLQFISRKDLPVALMSFSSLCSPASPASLLLHSMILVDYKQASIMLSHCNEREQWPDQTDCARQGLQSCLLLLELKESLTRDRFKKQEFRINSGHVPRPKNLQNKKGLCACQSIQGNQQLSSACF